MYLRPGSGPGRNFSIVGSMMRWLFVMFLTIPVSMRSLSMKALLAFDRIAVRRFGLVGV